MPSSPQEHYYQRMLQEQQRMPFPRGPVKVQGSDAAQSPSSLPSGGLINSLIRGLVAILQPSPEPYLLALVKIWNNATLSLGQKITESMIQAFHPPTLIITLKILFLIGIVALAIVVVVVVVAALYVHL